MDTKKYISERFEETVLDQDDIYFLKHPNSLYITIVTKENDQAGYFKLSYMFNDKNEIQTIAK